MKKHTALYARVSTEAQAEEGYSIDAQKKLLEAFCISKEIENFKFYVDAGFSGSNLERPAIKELLSDIELGIVDAVAVYKLDRISRSQKDTLYLIEDVFNPNNVGFISLSENMDTSTPIGRAMLGIMSAFAQLERETIKIRTRMGMRERVKSGLWMGGGKIPFGYSYDKESGTLVKNEDSDKVREIYSLYLQGYSPSAISQKLGMKYDKLVTQILKRETNTGVINYKGEKYQGKHEALIDRETYLAAQSEMKRRSKNVPYGTHLLSGLVFCGLCGARMRYQKWGNSGYRLVCYSTQKSKPYLIKDPYCKSERPWAEDVEAEVISDMFTMSLKRKKEEEYDESASLKNEEKRLQKKLSRMYNVYADGDDTALEHIRSIKEDIASIRERISICENSKAQRLSRMKLLDKAENLSEIWDTLSSEEQKRLIGNIVEKIVVYPEKIEIYYL